MTSADDDAAAIRARRKLTNRLIAAHDAPRLRPHLAEDAVVIVGDGSLILGADNVVAAFAAQFAEAGFVAFARVTETVETHGDRAAEAGRWEGTWKDGTRLAGPYLAAWRKVRGQWVIEREMFVTTQG